MIQRRTPPGNYPAAQSGQARRESGLNGIATSALIGFDGCDREAELLADSAGQKTAHAMRLPASRLHKFREGGALSPFQQIEDLRCLAAIPCALFLGGLGRFLRGAGLLGNLPLLGRNVPALCANTGLFCGFRLLGDASFFGSCVHIISLDGDYRDHMNHSDGPKMQVNCGEICE